MSRDTKELINSIEERNQMRTQLELTVESLRLEIEHLTFRNREQQLLISELKDKLSKSPREDVPEDIHILKEMVLSQRKELLKKEKDIDILKDRIYHFEIESKKTREDEKQESDEIIKANKMIISLTEENEIRNKEIEILKNKIQEIQSQKLIYRDLQKELQNSTSEKVQRLKDKNADLQKSVVEVKQMIQSVKKNFNDLGFVDILKDLTEENHQLNKKLLEKKEPKSIEIKFYKSSTMEFTNLPKYYQLSLFYNQFALLSDDYKELIIDLLIQDLKGSNGDIKRFVMKILSEMKHQKAHDALLEMLHDDDWIIRFCAVKALKSFDNQKTREKLKELLDDTDVDVREVVQKFLD